MLKAHLHPGLCLCDIEQACATENLHAPLAKGLCKGICHVAITPGQELRVALQDGHLGAKRL